MSTNTLLPEEIADWYLGKSFSADWTTWHFANWVEFLHPLRKRPVRVLEIGSWEGRSALFFLNYFPASQLACVDTFGGNIEHMRNPHFAALIAETEQRFDFQCRRLRPGRVEKIKGSSRPMSFRDSASRRAASILCMSTPAIGPPMSTADGALAWPVVEREGIVIFDDYEFDEIEDESERPEARHRRVSRGRRRPVRLMHKAYQVVIAKL